MNAEEIMKLADAYAGTKYRFAHVPSKVYEARAALEAAVLAQGEPEAWMYQYTRPDGSTYISTVLHDRYPHKEVAVYTHPAPVNAQEADNDEVICPKCVHQFRAIPVNVQERISELEEQNTALLEALRGMVDNFGWGDMNDGEYTAITKARAAIAAVESLK